MAAVAIDIETSGLDPGNGAEILMISACRMDDERSVTGRFDHLVRPTRPLREVVSGITGLIDEMFVDSPSFPELAAEFLDFIRGMKIICINMAFDRSFLNSALAKAGHTPLPADAFVDLLDQIPDHLGPKTTDTLFAYTGVEPDGSLTAGGGSLLVAEIYRITSGKAQVSGAGL